MNKETPTISVSELRRRLRAASNCDALATEEAWLRRFVYIENWHAGVDVVKFDNGGGDHAFVLFMPDGAALIKGFDHNSEVSPHARKVFGAWPGLYDGLPEAFDALLRNEVFEAEVATFCCWSEDGKRWKTGSAKIPSRLDDGSSWIVSAIQKDAAQFAEWGESYYGAKFELVGIDRVNREFLGAETSG